jgi:DNA modification methylase
MQIELRDIDSITPYEKNPRLNDDAVEAVAASIKEFGFRVPIVIGPDGVIICGHTRWKAAKKLQLAKVPVHVATDLTPEQVKAYRIADNKTAELAEWDFDQLRIEIADLQNADFDLGLLAFDEDELTRLLGGDNDAVTDGQTDPDAVPEPPDEAVSRRGQVYQLGEHRLMCGDSSSAADLDILLGGQPIHLVNTDPPYNVKVEPRSNNAIAAGLSSFPAASAIEASDAHGMHHQGFDLARDKSKAHPTHTQLRPKDRPLENDFVTDEEFDRLLDAWFGNAARVLLPGHGFYIWGGYANCGNYPPFLKKHKLYFSQAVIWDKQHPVLTRKDFMGAHEWCFYGWKEGAAHRFFGPNNATDLWHIKKVNPQSMVHLTEKPVALAVQAIQFSSERGENVLDLFGGSGSTLMGCEQTGRHGFLMEIDELYCDVIRKRWAEFVHGQGCDWQALTPAVHPAPAHTTETHPAEQPEAAQ